MADAPVRFVEKPWGREEIFAHTEAYVGKVLLIRQGEALSLQYHERKEETLRVLDGEVEVHLGTNAEELHSEVLDAGSVVHLPPRTLHRLVAVTDCRLVEVSTNHLDDVVRLDDRYGREGTKGP